MTLTGYRCRSLRVALICATLLTSAGLSAATLGTQAITVPGAASTQTVVLTTTGAWTATTNGGFLHTSASGSGNAVVSFTVDAFFGTGTRTGTLTIAGVNLAVTQVGTDYAAVSKASTLPVTPQPFPDGVAVDGSGNVYFVDANAGSLKVWSATSRQTTVLAPNSTFSVARALALDSAGNVFVADSTAATIKAWIAATQQLTTVVSTGLQNPNGIAVDAAGNLYITDSAANAVKKWTAATQQLATLVSGLQNPTGIAIDGSGNLYIVDTGSNSVKKWNASTQQLTTLVSSGLQAPYSVAVDGFGNLYIGDPSLGLLAKWTASSQQVTVLSNPISAVGVAVDGSGNVYSANAVSGGITKLDVAYQTLGVNSLTVSSAAGSNSASINYLPINSTAAWTASAADQWLHITNPSGSGPALLQFTYDANTASNTARIGTITLDSGLTLTVTQAGTNYAQANSLTALVSTGIVPTGVAVDSSGNAYIADSSYNAIRRWNAPSQQLTTLPAAGLSNPNGVAVDSYGIPYIADTTNNAVKMWNAATQQFVTLVGPIGAANPQGLNLPSGVALDGLSNVYIADTGNGAIKMWSAATQQVTTLASPASGLNYPWGLAVDGAGNVYIADTRNNAIKKWSAATHEVTTLLSTGLVGPRGVAVDGSGNLFIADTNTGSIKKWSPLTQQLTTLTTAGLATPYGVAVDAFGNLFVTDPHNGALYEMPLAFVGSVVSNSLPAIQGSGSLPPVIPVTTSLSGVFAPTSDQPWLHVGPVNNGVLNFSFDANPTVAQRTGHITVLGQSIILNQANAAAPITNTMVTTISDLNFSAFAQSVPVSATVQSSTVPNTGTVTFTIKDSGLNTIATLAGVTVVSGVATGTMSVPAGQVSGAYSLNATYSGGGPYNGSTATPTTFKINAPVAGSSAFLGVDAITQGSWNGKFGADGYVIANGAIRLPSYANVSIGKSYNLLPPATAAAFTWAGQTTDPRALQNGANATTRIAAGYIPPDYSNNFQMTITAKDTNKHQVALYLLDWDSTLRTETIAVTDSNSAPLDTESISGFGNGKYAVWTFQGSVNITVTGVTGGPVVSGIFFDPAVPTPQPSFALTATAVSAAAGGAAGTSTIKVIPANGFNSPVTLSASGWPAGITGTFATNPTTGSSSVTINMVSNVAAGLYSLLVNGVSGSLNASTTIALTVTPVPTPSITLSATATSAPPGGSGTSQITITPLGFNSTVTLFASSDWPAGITPTFGPPSFFTAAVTINVASTVTPGPYSLTLVGIAGTLSGSTTIALTVTGGSASASASYVGTDLATQGTWTGKYGANGLQIASGASTLPRYANVSFNGTPTYTWAGQTTDVRALQVSSGATTGIASTYYGSTFNINVNLTDGNTHQVALYLLDWDTTNRAETIAIIDAVTNVVLDQQSLSGFHNGQYAVWNIKGNVIIKVTSTGGLNAGVSGIFFGPGTNAPPPPPPTPSFTLTAPAASAVQGSYTNLNVAIIPANGFNSLVTLATPNWPAGITGAFAPNPAGLAGSGLTINVKTTVAPGPYTLTVTGASGSLTSSTEIAFTVTAGSGLGAGAAFTGLDTTTSGTWTGKYGASGYMIASGNSSAPSYAAANLTGALTYTWAGQTSDPRALQVSPGSATGIASSYTQYPGASFSINVNISNMSTHNVSLYLLDWDTNSRFETVTVIDAVTNLVLDTQTFTGFHNGAYASWDIRGNVIIRVTPGGSTSPVVSGIFFN